jgi:uncharacterized membrane-anchored protein YitT (DUF2179 family)
MSDKPNGNGKYSGVTGMAHRLIAVLPPAFLLLVVLNIVFIGFLVWFLDHNATQRNDLLTKIVAGCLKLDKGDSP